MNVSKKNISTACSAGANCLNVVESEIGGIIAIDFHCSGFLSFMDCTRSKMRKHTAIVRLHVKMHVSSAMGRNLF